MDEVVSMLRKVSLCGDNVGKHLRRASKSNSSRCAGILQWRPCNEPAITDASSPFQREDDTRLSKAGKNISIDGDHIIFWHSNRSIIHAGQSHGASFISRISSLVRFLIDAIYALGGVIPFYPQWQRISVSPARGFLRRYAYISHFKHSPSSSGCVGLLPSLF